MATAKKTNSSLWESSKKKAIARMGGKHSARAMQLAVKLYKKAGGGYKGKKSSSNSLSKWSKQNWTTGSGKKSKDTGEAYFPKKAVEALKKAGKYQKATAQKRAAAKKGKQFARYSPDIQRIVKRYR